MKILVYLLFIIGLIGFSGLYNPAHIYLYTILLFPITGFLLLFKLKKKVKVNVPIWLLPLPFLSVMPLLFQVESVQGTLDEYLVWCALFAFGILLLQINERAVQLPLLLLAINWTTIAGTYLVLLGIISVPQFILSLSKEVSGLGERLGGFLQYPNAFASILGAMILFHLVQAVGEPKKSWAFLHKLLPLFAWPLFLLTESRGAWLMFIIVWFFTFYVMSKKTHIRYLIISGFIFVCGTIVYTSIILNGTSTINWISLVVVISFGVLLWWVERKKLLTRITDPRSIHLVPLTLLVGFMFLFSDLYWKGALYHILPSSLQQRLLFNFDTFSERALYWKDALLHWDEFTFTGLGGKAWQILMYRIQTSPYLTSEVHNGYLDIWIEMGLIGLLFVLFLLIKVSVQLFKERTASFSAFLFLLLHGFLEFTFSYPIILFYLLILSLCREEKIKQHASKQPVLLILAFIVLTSGSWFSITFARAENAYHHVQSAVTIKEAAAAVQDAYKLNPWQTQYVRFAVEYQLLSPEEQTIWLNKAIEYEPNHSWLLYHAAKAAEENDEVERAKILYQRSMETNRFENRSK